MSEPETVAARLRDCTCVPHGDICREAADKIERLRNERDDARKRLVLLIADLGRGGLPRYQNLIRNSHRLNMDFVNLVWSVINTELETDER